MNQELHSAKARRAQWWLAQRNDFGLPNALYAPGPVAVMLVLGLGVGSGFLGLFPGANTHEMTLSGVGAPWIGLVILLAIAGLWYWQVFHNGYSRLAMGAIVGVACVVAVLISTLTLDVLVDENPDAVVGALGAMGWIIGALLLMMGLLFEWFIVSLLMGALMGLLIGLLVSFGLGGSYIPIMMVVYGSIGILAGGLGGLLRPVLLRAFRRR